MTKPILLSSSVFSEAEGLLFTTRVQIFSAHTRDIKKKKFNLCHIFFFQLIPACLGNISLTDC